MPGLSWGSTRAARVFSAVANESIATAKTHGCHTRPARPGAPEGTPPALAPAAAGPTEPLLVVGGVGHIQRRPVDGHQPQPAIPRSPRRVRRKWTNDGGEQ